MKIAVTAFMLTLVTVTQAFAWGSEGHRIIAEIAQQYLEPATARQVRDLLAVDNVTTLADVANWADQIRMQRRDTATWHFVDIPVSAGGYDAARDCGQDNCVVAKIDQFTAELRDKSLPPRQRLEALEFVVHFIGDVHQPLHAADNGDRGGNEIHVRYPRRKTNLHALWDSGILNPVVHGDDRGYALYLVRQIKPAQMAAWRSGGPVDWANESHTVAVKVIYGELPHEEGTLPAAYGRVALPIVNEQLERAGVRLAMVLNDVLGN